MSAYGNAAVAQSVERRLGKAEVTGSIPVSSFFCVQKQTIFCLNTGFAGFKNSKYMIR